MSAPIFDPDPSGPFTRIIPCNPCLNEDGVDLNAFIDDGDITAPRYVWVGSWLPTGNNPTWLSLQNDDYVLGFALTGFDRRLITRSDVSGRDYVVVPANFQPQTYIHILYPNLWGAPVSAGGLKYFNGSGTPNTNVQKWVIGSMVNWTGTCIDTSVPAENGWDFYRRGIHGLLYREYVIGNHDISIDSTPIAIWHPPADYDPANTLGATLTVEVNF